MTDEKKFVPFISANENMKEFTIRALLIGLVLAVVLGAANAYLGLKAGMTIAATYPAAVIGMAILRFFKGSILEENFTRTVGSIGESVAAGAIFTLPAFYISGVWSGEEFSSINSYLTASLILITGGTLGVLFVALLRRVMVEDKELPFPESVAAAEIHKTGQGGAGGSKYLFSAMIVGALVKIAGDLRLFATEWTHFIKTSTASFANGKMLEGGFLAGGPNISPAYLGVGYIIGPKLSALNFSGSVMAWGLMVPMLLMMLGSSFVASLPVNEGLDASTSIVAWENAANVVWREIVRIIAIGGMLVAACFTLYRMRSSLGTGLRRSVKDLKRAAQGSEENIDRTEKDLKSSWILIGICAAAVLTFIITYFIFHTSILVAVVASTIMIVLAFFFAAVSGYLVGIIGSSNNPISGLTLTALVVTAIVLVACGVDASHGGVAAVLGIAAIVCVAAAVGGEMFQDLKAGHILGGTPWRMQIGDIIGVLISGFVMFGVLIILNQGDINMGIEQGYQGGFGSKNLSAPQAGLMATLSQGIVGGQMTWALITAGMILGFAFILMGIKSPMLIFVGMYLPFNTVFAIFAGGLIKGILDLYAARRKYNERQIATVENTGVLLASGMIAGEALMGLVIAIFAMFNIFFSNMLSIGSPLYSIGIVIVLIIGYFFVNIPLKKADSMKK
ncbi:MAG: oligopeptide transporter, OPT family [Dysgonamonadaceae bacterium]|jgi:putative OPT family oligopeptide transporter|nr:oligopeptide transporter, OPT family [Dysgonamonadaceae bacterium]